MASTPCGCARGALACMGLGWRGARRGRRGGAPAAHAVAPLGRRRSRRARGRAPMRPLAAPCGAMQAPCARRRLSPCPSRGLRSLPQHEPTQLPSVSQPPPINPPQPPPRPPPPTPPRATPPYATQARVLLPVHPLLRQGHQKVPKLPQAAAAAERPQDIPAQLAGPRRDARGLARRFVPRQPAARGVSCLASRPRSRRRPPAARRRPPRATGRVPGAWHPPY
jgi:hypothetical protein